MDWKTFRAEMEKAAKLIALKKYRESNRVLEEQLLGKFSYMDNEILLAIGNNYFYMGDLEKAIDCADRALLLNPTFHKAHYLKARSYQKRKNFNNQNKSIELALGFKPNNLSYLINKAEYLICIKKYQEASSILKGLEAREPNNYTILYSICRIYLLQKKRKKFDAKIANAMALFPSEAGFHNLLCGRHLEKKKYKKAIESAKKSLEISPVNNDAKKLLENAELRLKNAPDYSMFIGMFVLLVSVYLLGQILDFLITVFKK